MALPLFLAISGRLGRFVEIHTKTRHVNQKSDVARAPLSLGIAGAIIKILPAIPRDIGAVFSVRQESIDRTRIPDN